MDLSVIGPWVFVGIGVLLVASGGRMLFSNKAKTTLTIFVLIFGVGVTGVGVWGPSFLQPYGDFIKLLLKMQDSPGTESYAAFFEGVASGDVPAEYAKVGLSFALDAPVPGMDSLLVAASNKARDPEVRRTLSDTRHAYQARLATAAIALGRTDSPPGPIAPPRPKLDSASRAYIARPLLAAPDTTLARLQLDRRKIMTALRSDGL